MNIPTNAKFRFFLLALSMSVAWFLLGHLPTPLVVGLALLAFVIAHWWTFEWRTKRRRIVGGIFLVFSLAPCFLGIHITICLHGPRPEPTVEELFQGVQYIREIILKPRPAVVHILRVDLSTEGVQVLVTPPDDLMSDLPLQKRTTTQFLSEFQVQAAVNASNFYPFEKGLGSIIDLVAPGSANVLGGAASDGIQYGTANRFYPILHIGPKNRATIKHQMPRPWHNAIAGIKHFIIDGKPIHMNTKGDPLPTTSVGIDRTGSILFLVVVDGRQEPYSVGLNRVQLTEVLLNRGVYNALSLDGGGSSAMVVEAPDGDSKTLSQPINAGVPQLQRAVGNHLGIRARRIGE